MKTLHARVVASFGLVITAATLCVVRPAAAQTACADARRTIEATGVGTVSAAPDRAAIALSVSSTEATAADAVAKTAETMKAVVARVKAALGDGDTVSTRTYQVRPEYEYDKGRQTRKIVGYVAQNSIDVETAALERAGALIDTAVSAGVDDVQGVRFFLADDTQQRREAVVKAGRAASAEAEAAAEALGVALGPVLNAVVAPRFGPMPRPVFAQSMRMAEAGDARPPTELRPGEVEVSATVHASYQIQ